MALIENAEAMANFIQSGIATLAALAGRKVGDIDAKVALLLSTTERTLQNWKNPQNISQRIEDSQLLGFAWLMLTQGEKDLAWLTSFVKATDLVFYDPPSQNLVRTYLRKVRLNGQAVADNEIEAMIGRLFGETAANPRIARISSEWCTAMPIEVGDFSSVSEEPLYLLFFDAEIKLYTYFVYFKEEYVAPNYLKLEGMDFERRQWKFKISPEWVNAHQAWNKETFWKIDYYNRK